MSQQTPSFASWNTPDTSGGTNSHVAFGPNPVFRNSKDALLSGIRTAVDTTYPDGYLGTMSSNRRQDKILGTLSRMNARQYSRGVHKGERINSGDYFWPDEFNKYTAIQYQMAGKKFAPSGAEPVRLTNDGKVGPRGIQRNMERADAQEISEERRAKLRSLKPAWR